MNLFLPTEAAVTWLCGRQLVPQWNLEGSQLPLIEAFLGGAGMPHFFQKPPPHVCLEIQVALLGMTVHRPLSNTVTTSHLGSEPSKQASVR